MVILVLFDINFTLPWALDFVKLLDNKIHCKWCSAKTDETTWYQNVLKNPQNHKYQKINNQKTNLDSLLYIDCRKLIEKRVNLSMSVHNLYSSPLFLFQPFCCARKQRNKIYIQDLWTNKIVYKTMFAGFFSY